MRLWIDERERVLTDEQLLRRIAHCGSLGGALADGDVRLIAQPTTPRVLSRAVRPQRKLSDYLDED